MGESYTLLTIEDEAAVIRSIRAFFEDMGVTVLDAPDGKTGVELFRKHRPAVVLVDLRMPGMSGLEVIDVLSREAPGVPIVVLSGTGVVADAIEAIRRGAWDYVLKPIKDMMELDHVVNNVLERARLREETRRYHEHLEEEISLRTRQLRESEEKYRELVENINDVIFVVDRDGTVSYMNPVVERMTGYKPEEIVGRHFGDFLAQRDPRRMQSTFQALLNGQSPQGDYLLLKKSGEPLWVRASIRPVRRGGQIVGIQGILSDVTTRKLADAEIETRTRELELLNRLGQRMGQDLSVDAIVNTLLTAAMEAFGPDIVLLFLREGEGMVFKRAFPEENPLSQKGIPIHRIGECLCGLALRDGQAVYSVDIHTESRCTYPECKETGLRSFACLPLIGAGQAIGVLGLASFAQRDFGTSAPFMEAFGHEVAIGLRNALLYEKAQADAVELQTRLTQIQQAQKEKEELMLQLHRAQKMEAIGTLAGGIAHDFNNILTPIIMGTELALMNIPPTSPVRKNLQRVKDAGARAKDLVKQILTFSRQGDSQKGPIRVGPVLKEAIKLARAALPATIEIRQDIRTDRDTVLADPTQIHQVIVNLMTNAAHAMREKGGILEFTLDEEMLDERKAAGMGASLCPGPFVRLMVRDTGHGMDRETLEKIFDPFFTTKPRGEGTGLGLATVDGIVRACGGAVLVESEVGAGSLFTVYLPRIEPVSERRGKGTETIPRGTERILFVDDEPMVAETQAELLRALGYQVEYRTNPLEALNLFKQAPQSYDLVITDMTMPRMTGEELGRVMMGIRPGIPVIVCTGFSENMTEERALELGFCSFAMKPLVIEEIAHKIRTALDGAAARNHPPQEVMVES